VSGFGQRPSRKGAQLTARNLMLRRGLLQGSSPELCLEDGFQSFSAQGEAIRPTDDARLLRYLAHSGEKRTTDGGAFRGLLCAVLCAPNDLSLSGRRHEVLRTVLTRVF